MQLRNIMVIVLFCSLFSIAASRLLWREVVQAAPFTAIALRSESQPQATLAVSHPTAPISGGASLLISADQASVAAALRTSSTDSASNGSLMGGLLMGVLGLIVLAELIRRRMSG